MSIFLFSYFFKLGFVHSAVGGMRMVFFKLFAEGIHNVVVQRKSQINLVASCQKQELAVKVMTGNCSKPNRLELTETVVFSLDTHTLLKTKVPNFVVYIKHQSVLRSCTYLGHVNGSFGKDYLMGFLKVDAVFHFNVSKLAVATPAPTVQGKGVFGIGRVTCNSQTMVFPASDKVDAGQVHDLIRSALLHRCIVDFLNFSGLLLLAEFRSRLFQTFGFDAKLAELVIPTGENLANLRENQTMIASSRAHAHRPVLHLHEGG